jgi:hypothetical protein
LMGLMWRSPEVFFLLGFMWLSSPLVGVSRHEAEPESSSPDHQAAADGVSLQTRCAGSVDFSDPPFTGQSRADRGFAVAERTFFARARFPQGLQRVVARRNRPAGPADRISGTEIRISEPTDRISTRANGSRGPSQRPDGSRDLPAAPERRPAGSEIRISGAEIRSRASERRLSERERRPVAREIRSAGVEIRLSVATPSSAA